MSANDPAITATEAYVRENFVQKESGKGLSHNDYTNTEKTALATAAEAATLHARLISALSAAVESLASNKANLADVAVVAGGLAAIVGQDAGKSARTIAQEEAASVGGKFIVVAELPGAATADRKAIYLVPRETAETDNIYDEYIVVEPTTGTLQWDKIGSTEIDLSGYKQKQTAVADPTASGTATSFISSITQDENGVITPVKKSMPSPVAPRSATAPGQYADAKATGDALAENEFDIARVEGKLRYAIMRPWDGSDAPGTNVVAGLVVTSSTATLQVLHPVLQNGVRVYDFYADVVNEYGANAEIELGGLGSDWEAVVRDGESLSQMTTLAPGEMARFHFTETAFPYRNGRPVFLVTKTVLVEPGSGGATYQLETDGTVSTEGELNSDGTLTVEGELNSDGTLTVEAL